MVEPWAPVPNWQALAFPDGVQRSWRKKNRAGEPAQLGKWCGDQGFQKGLAASELADQGSRPMSDSM